MSDKPTLHASDLTTLDMCQMRYFYRRVEGIIAPPGIAALVGTSVHKSVQADMTTKIETGKLQDEDYLADLTADFLKAKWSADGVNPEDEEIKEHGEKKAQALAVDKAVSLSGLHHVHVAPVVAPAHVERKWRLNLEGYPLDLAGTIDLQEQNLNIRDTKTGAKTLPQSDADNSTQLTMYAMAAKVCDGKLPAKLYLDNLVALKTPKAVTLETTRDEEDIRILLRRVERAIKVIEAGNFMPCDPTNWCHSPRWCGYWSRCPYARNPVSIGVKK